MNSEEKKAWKEVGYSKKFANAFRGLRVFAETTKNFKIYILGVLVVVLLGFALQVSSFEWMALTFAIGLVFLAEAFNTAIEIDIDLTSPEFHPYARDTKDVAAGAVLISVFMAIIVGLIIFLPKILLYVKM